jgi:hypothetical protein
MIARSERDPILQHCNTSAQKIEDFKGQNRGHWNFDRQDGRLVCRVRPRIQELESVRDGLKGNVGPDIPRCGHALYIDIILLEAPIPPTDYRTLFSVGRQGHGTLAIGRG